MPRAKCQCGQEFNFDPDDPRACPDCDGKSALSALYPHTRATGKEPFYKKSTTTRGWRIRWTQGTTVWLDKEVYKKAEAEKALEVAPAKMYYGDDLIAEKVSQLIYFPNKMEANYYRYLLWLKEKGEIFDFVYQPPVNEWDFVKHGHTGKNSKYKPDFCVLRNSGLSYWIELKGYMDSNSKVKLNRARKYYPNRDLRVIGYKEYKELAKSVAGAIPGWEE